MDKVSTPFLDSSVEHVCPNRAFDETFSDSDLHIHDKRVARLLVLLQQLNESVERLEALSEPELRETVSSAIRVCGFRDPIEAREVIAPVLDAIEMQDPFSEMTALAGQGMGLSDT